MTDAGTATAELLLERETRNGAVAAALSCTEQACVADPVIVALLQETAVNAGAIVASFGTPVPIRVTAAFGLVEELLVMISCPAAAPALAGLKFTFNLYVSPTASVTGRLLLPLAENAFPFTVSWESWIGVTPLLRTSTVVLTARPTITEPKETVAGDVTNAPVKLFWTK